MNSLPAEWELDYYSRPLLDPKGKKRWELLLSSSNNNFRFERFCSAESVNSQWLKQAISDALAEAEAKKYSNRSTLALLAQFHAHDGAASC